MNDTYCFLDHIACGVCVQRAVEERELLISCPVCARDVHPGEIHRLFFSSDGSASDAVLFSGVK